MGYTPTKADAILATVFSPHGGSDNFLNLRSPGAHPAKIWAEGAQTGGDSTYPSQGYVPKPTFDGQQGIGTGIDTPDPAGRRSRGLTLAEARSQHYSGSDVPPLSGGSQARGNTYATYPSPKRTTGPSGNPSTRGEHVMNKGTIPGIVKNAFALSNDSPGIYGGQGADSSLSDPMAQSMGQVATAQSQNSPTTPIMSEEDERAIRRQDMAEADDADKTAEDLEQQAKAARMRGDWALADGLVKSAINCRASAMQIRKRHQVTLGF